MKDPWAEQEASYVPDMGSRPVGYWHHRGVRSLPAHVVDEVLTRAGEHCEACGWPAGGEMHFHHRKLRSRGGQDSVANLLWVHASCHVLTPWAIHNNVARATALGHIVAAGEDPGAIPVKLAPQLRSLPHETEACVAGGDTLRSLGESEGGRTLRPGPRGIP